MPGTSCLLLKPVDRRVLWPASLTLEGQSCNAPVRERPSARWKRVTSAGGVFRLCWCHSMPNFDSEHVPSCLASEAKADVGSLFIVGVSLFQDRTCVSGSTCEIPSVYGYGLRDTDRLYVMDTCGGTSIISGFAQGLRSLGSGDAEFASFSWGSTRVTAAGGIYQLCWCGSTDGEGCDSAQNALVTLGSLTLVGVNPLSQDRTCVSGQTCSISGLGGQDLPSVGSALLVLETCGLPSLPRGFWCRCMADCQWIGREAKLPEHSSADGGGGCLPPLLVSRHPCLQGSYRLQHRYWRLDC